MDKITNARLTGAGLFAVVLILLAALAGAVVYMVQTERAEEAEVSADPYVRALESLPENPDAAGLTDEDKARILESL